jgi:hypothetical protein
MNCAKCARAVGPGTATDYTFAYGTTAPEAPEAAGPRPFELAGWGQAFLCNPCLGDFALGANKLRKTWLAVAGVLVVDAVLIFTVGLVGVVLLLIAVLGAAWTVGRLNERAQIRWNPRGDDPDLSATRCGEMLAIELHRPTLSARGFDAFLTRADYAVLSRV